MQYFISYVNAIWAWKFFRIQCTHIQFVVPQLQWYSTKSCFMHIKFGAWSSSSWYILGARSRAMHKTYIYADSIMLLGSFFCSKCIFYRGQVYNFFCQGLRVAASLQNLTWMFLNSFHAIYLCRHQIEYLIREFRSFISAHRGLIITQYSFWISWFQ